MNLVDEYLIQNVANSAVASRDNRFRLHATTVAYIKLLFGPISQKLSEYNSVQDVRSNVLNTIYLDLAEIAPFRDPLSPEELQNFKLSIVRALIKVIILRVFANYSKPDGGKPRVTIFPWEIQEAISTMPKTSVAFGIGKDDYQLPVDIIINNNPSTILADEYIVAMFDL